MADALTRIVQRAMHPHAGVRPHPRRRFEALAADGPHAPAPEPTTPPTVSADEPGTTLRWVSAGHGAAEPIEVVTGRGPHPTVAAAASSDRPPTPRAPREGTPARAVPEVAPGGVGRADAALTLDPTTASRRTAAPVPRATVTRIRPRPADPPQNRTDSAEPVVHISIGRVEVRAEVVSSTVATAPPPPERRVLPLEEYLAHRAEGRAR